jgi:cytochrome P450
MQPFTFSNGITISPGETLASPAAAVHLDDSIYENAKEFDGFRFSALRELDGDSAKTYSVNTGTEFLTFGHGEHAWYQPNSQS